MSRWVLQTCSQLPSSKAEPPDECRTAGQCFAEEFGPWAAVDWQRGKATQDSCLDGGGNMNAPVAAIAHRHCLPLTPLVICRQYKCTLEEMVMSERMSLTCA
ncbi:hypothetical protein BJX76DRAFT_107344 [Aspergillus varians]